MANVINRTTKQYLRSVNTPDFPVEDWIINPDLSALESVPQKYWKVVGDTVVEMDQAEKDAVDAALAPKVQVRFHGSSTIVQGQLNVVGGDWTSVGGVVTTPGFFAPVASLKSRIIGSYKTAGLGAEIRLMEDGTKELGLFALPDSAGAWAQMQWFSSTPGSEGTHEYTLEMKLGTATSVSVRYVSMSLLEFYV